MIDMYVGVNLVGMYKFCSDATILIKIWIIMNTPMYLFISSNKSSMVF